MYGRIAIAYDGSSQAERALTAAIDLAKNFGAELVVLTGVGGQPLYAAYADALDPGIAQLLSEDRLAVIEQQQRKARVKVETAGVKVTTHIIDDDGIDEAVALLRALSIDLLIVGIHHKMTRIARLWNTVYELAEDAPCSVLGIR